MWKSTAKGRRYCLAAALFGFWVIVMAAASVAQAQPLSYESYYQVSVGADFTANTDGDEDGLELHSGPMPVVLAIAGADFQDVIAFVDLALELEGGYRLAEPHNVNRGIGTTVDPTCECLRDENTEANGYGHQVTFMANALPNVSIRDVELFAGPGAGLMWQRALGENEVVFAAQAVARACYEFTNALHGCLDYRYLRGLEAEFDGVSIDPESHAVLVGFRHVF